MTDSTLDSELFWLQNNWGVQGPVLVGHIPKGGFDGSDTHNVATAKYQLGTVCRVYCDGSTGQKGWSDLMYMVAGTQAATAIAAKTFCTQVSATVPLTVTNATATAIKLPTDKIAIAVAAITNAYYGWFWVGGVCPEQYVSGLGGNYKTNGSVAAGNIKMVDVSTTLIMGMGPATAAGTTADTKTSAGGYALAADA